MIDFSIFRVKNVMIENPKKKTLSKGGANPYAIRHIRIKTEEGKNIVICLFGDTPDDLKNKS